MTRLFISSVLLLQLGLLSSQNCQWILTGTVNDQYHNEPLAFANIWIEELERGESTDEKGNFKIENICSGDYHIRTSHIGCETVRIFLTISSDTTLNLNMPHTTAYLQEVVVKGATSAMSSSRTAQTLGDELINENFGKTLSSLLENITGVSSLRNGSGISKPIIHGLYGNRLSLINNGVLQSGQQWGNDHAPEIDPNIASKITVVKGVGTLEYLGNDLGAAVIIEPGPIKKDPHLHGLLKYNYSTNGRIHNTHFQIGQSGSIVDWRAGASWKKGGDQQTPDYYLTNTGVREANGFLQLSKNWNPSQKSDLYYSFFSTTLGILRGSHIGNLTDLLSAIGKSEPFFTANQFSYNINSPRQEVKHHLLKLDHRYSFTEDHWLTLSYGFQFNDRQEYDVRRSGRSLIPALSIGLISHNLEAKYVSEQTSNSWHAGLQLRYADGDNRPETGIRPLLPDFQQRQLGVYSTHQFHLTDHLNLEVGGRLDYNNLRVARIVGSPASIERLSNNYLKKSFLTGLQFEKADWTSKFNFGYIERPPEVNELYAQGLHQGVSGIEQGDPNLKKETSWKAIWTNQYVIHHQLLVEGSIYWQAVNNYMYLQAANDYRLTVRGAFPLFNYEQTNARIVGADVTIKIEASEQFKTTINYSYIRGENVSRSIPLINIPANQGKINLQWLSHDDITKEHQTEFFADFLYKWQQQHLLPEQDFLIAPPAYFLADVGLRHTRRFNHSEFTFSFTIENLLNTRYRDYLNRLRYYADEQGRNLKFTSIIKF